MVLDKAIKENLPNQIWGLIGGPQNALARNALAGWATEMDQYLKHASGTDSAAIMQDVLFFGTFKDYPWAGVSPIDLIGKDEAIWLLTHELTQRAPFRLEAGINWYRFLCPWRWPQSSLFPKPAGAPVYSRRQLTLLAQSLWPEGGEDGDLARAELLALRYGQSSRG